MIFLYKNQNTHNQKNHTSKNTQTHKYGQIQNKKQKSPALSEEENILDTVILKVHILSHFQEVYIKP